MSQFEPRLFEEVCGGLRTKIIPRPWQQINEISLSENTLEEESDCLLIHEYENVHWEIDDDRRHYRMINGEFLEYYPSFYPQPLFSHRTTQYAWSIHCNLHKPDYKYLQALNRGLISHLKMMEYHLSEGNFYQMDNFSLSESLYNIKWLDPGPKRMLFIYMAKLLSKEEELKNIILENCHLRHEDGFRLLLTFSLTVGDKLENLYLWHFFIKGVMPLNIGYKEDMNDPYLLTSDLKVPVSSEEKKMIWEDYLMDDIGYDLPHDYFHYFTIFLKTLTNLTKLYVSYSWVSLGQGMTLNLLGSIRNGHLKDLYLLCTMEDMPYISGSRIAPIAWVKAKHKCPKLNVHLVVMNVGASYDDNVTLLQDEMPLRSYQLHTGLPVFDYNQVKEPWFDCLLRTVIYKYSKTLRRLYLEVWYTRQRVDVMLARCLTDLPLLEEFMYCGAFDKIDTIKEICEYLLNYSTKIKFIKLLILEDPCSSQKFRDVMAEIEEKYKQALYDRGINCFLGTHVI